MESFAFWVAYCVFFVIGTVAAQLIAPFIFDGIEDLIRRVRGRRA